MKLTRSILFLFALLGVLCGQFSAAHDTPAQNETVIGSKSSEALTKAGAINKNAGMALAAGLLIEVPLAKGQAEDSFDVRRAFTEEKAGPPVRDHVVLQAADSSYAIRMGD